MLPRVPVQSLCLPVVVSNLTARALELGSPGLVQDLLSVTGPCRSFPQRKLSWSWHEVPFLLEATLLRVRAHPLQHF